jgi:hypothetical protein
VLSLSNPLFRLTYSPTFTHACDSLDAFFSIPTPQFTIRRAHSVTCINAHVSLASTNAHSTRYWSNGVTSGDNVSTTIDACAQKCRVNNSCGAFEVYPADRPKSVHSRQHPLSPCGATSHSTVHSVVCLSMTFFSVVTGCNDSLPPCVRGWGGGGTQNQCRFHPLTLFTLQPQVLLAVPSQPIWICAERRMRDLCQDERNVHTACSTRRGPSTATERIKCVREPPFVIYVRQVCLSLKDCCLHFRICFLAVQKIESPQNE